MALLTSFLKQSCVWRRPSGYSPDGSPLYLYEEEIPCRWVGHVRRVLDAAGEAHETVVDVYTLSPVGVGDQLERDGLTVTVRMMNEYVSFSGAAEGRKVSCS